MRVNVLVIVTSRHVAELPVKAFAARVFFSRWTPAITSPIPKRFGDFDVTQGIRKNCPTFACRHLVSRIETARCEIPKSADTFAVVSRAQSVATVFDQK